MSYDEPFYSGSGADPYTSAYDVGTAISDRSYYAANSSSNPWNTPTYTNMPEGRMQVEQAGFPAISRYMCGTCPRYENPQPPPMRKVSLDARSDFALDNYPPDHDTVRSSCRRCASGYGGGCVSCGGGYNTAAATGVISRREGMESSVRDVEAKYAPSMSMSLSPMHIDMTSFVLVFLFIIVVFICISFSRTIGDIRKQLEKLTAQTI